MNSKNAVRRAVLRQRRQQKDFDRETARLIASFGGDPTVEPVERAPVEQGYALAPTVLPVHAGCLVCGVSMRSGQVVNVIRRRYVHVGECSDRLRMVLP